MRPAPGALSRGIVTDLVCDIIRGQEQAGDRPPGALGGGAKRREIGLDLADGPLTRHRENLSGGG